MAESSSRPDIHRLVPGDAGFHAGLLALFAAAFDDPETCLAAPPGAAWRDRLLADDGFVGLVALEGGDVVGALTAYELRKPERERSEFYLYDLAVAEHRRRRGIATALIGRLVQVATERGAHAVFVQADRGDDAAIALYTALGVREDVLHFDIPTGESD